MKNELRSAISKSADQVRRLAGLFLSPTKPMTRLLACAGTIIGGVVLIVMVEVCSAPSHAKILHMASTKLQDELKDNIQAVTLDALPPETQVQRQKRPILHMDGYIYSFSATALLTEGIYEPSNLQEFLDAHGVSATDLQKIIRLADAPDAPTEALQVIFAKGRLYLLEKVASGSPYSVSGEFLLPRHGPERSTIRLLTINKDARPTGQRMEDWQKRFNAEIVVVGKPDSRNTKALDEIKAWLAKHPTYTAPTMGLQ